VLLVANDSDENWSHATPGQSLRNQMELDSVRAASQLPGTHMYTLSFNIC